MAAFVAQSKSRGDNADTAPVPGDSHAYQAFSPVSQLWWVCGVSMSPPGAWDAYFQRF